MISAVVLTKNEEKNIVDCLETLLWCDEIIIIDDFSADMTLEAIKSFNKENIFVFQHHLNDNFSAQRNFGLSKTKGDWILFIDADERVSEELKVEISHLTTTNDRHQKLNGYFVKRRDVMWGKELKYGEVGNIKLLRLAKKSRGEWKGKIHEVWDIKGKLGSLKNHLVHYPHPTIKEFLSEINRYSSLRAGELFEKNVQVPWWSVLLYPKGKFFFNFILRRGFLDGTPGFVSAAMMSFHSFLVRAKLWLLNESKRRKVERDIFHPS